MLVAVDQLFDLARGIISRYGNRKCSCDSRSQLCSGASKAIYHHFRALGSVKRIVPVSGVLGSDKALGHRRISDCLRSVQNGFRRQRRGERKMEGSPVLNAIP